MAGPGCRIGATLSGRDRAEHALITLLLAKLQPSRMPRDAAKRNYTQGLRWSLWQGSKDIPWHTLTGKWRKLWCLHATGQPLPHATVCLTVLQPKFLEQFRNARFHFKSGLLDQQGTFKGVWLNAERTEWALEKEQQ